MTQYAVVKGEPRDQETMMERLRVTHAKLQEAYAGFNKVMDLAERMWPKQPPVSAIKGVVKECRHCKFAYAEKRDAHSAEYGFCSVTCFESEVVPGK